MDKSGRIFISIIIAFIIIGAGLATGFYIRFKSPPIQTVVEESIPPPQNDNIYEISPPSRGAIIGTLPIDIKPIGNVSSVSLPATNAAQIQTGQKILFYGSDNVMLEMVGEVTKLIPSGNDQVIVYFILNGDEELPVSKIAKGEIVISKNSNAPRLPLSALIRNEKGETYVWEAIEGEDKMYIARLTTAVVGDRNYQFFVLDSTPAIGGVYILNPDEKLRDGQKINANTKLYSAPAQTDETRMELVMKARQARLKEKHNRRVTEELKEQARLHAQQELGGGSNTCNITEDFLQTVKNLGQQPPPATLPVNNP